MWLRSKNHSGNLVAALAIQTGRSHEAGPVLSRRGQEDEVAGERLVLLQQHHVADLKKKTPQRLY